MPAKPHKLCTPLLFQQHYTHWWAAVLASASLAAIHCCWLHIHKCFCNTWQSPAVCNTKFVLSDYVMPLSCSGRWINPLMGWTSTSDPLENVSRAALQFYTKVCEPGRCHSCSSNSNSGSTAVAPQRCRSAKGWTVVGQVGLTAYLSCNDCASAVAVAASWQEELGAALHRHVMGDRSASHAAAAAAYGQAGDCT
jgi:hypothetical protein